MPTKASHNDWTWNADSDAEGTEPESESDDEKEFDGSKGKKLKGSAYLKYTEIKRWSTGKDSILEPAQINHEIYTLMEKFMLQSRLMH